MQVGGVDVVGLRRADEQVAAELEIGGHQVVVGLPVFLSGGKLFDAFAGGHAGIQVFAKVDAHAVVVLMIQILVLLLQLFITFSYGITEALARQSLLISSNILVVDDVGADGYIEGGLVGSFHRELTIGLT